MTATTSASSTTKTRSPTGETFDLPARVKTAPEAPGVYIMRDKKGKIVYVGKSVNLRNRLRAYANQTDSRSFVRRLPYVLGEVETIITPTEKDALQLECTLINAHRPRYNVAIPGEGAQVSLRLDVSEAAPRVEIVREVANDGAKYFGPYRSAFAVRRLKGVLDRHFMLRTCTDAVMANRTRPCLQYQIKRCSAPCVFDVDRIGYGEHVENATDFLSGRREELKARLNEQMWGASERLEYELAAHYRDQLAAIDLSEAKREGPVSSIDVDVFGHYREGEAVTLQVMFVRRGRLKGSRHHTFEDQPFDEEEIYSSFLNLYYSNGAYIPHEVVVPVEIEQREALEEVLSELRSSRVTIKKPERGKKAVLLKTAMQNAMHSFKEAISVDGHRANLLSRLQTSLKLKNYPTRIECFDVSNFQGAPIVGSMVVFEDGEALRKGYRTYKIKGVDGQDDFASMYEMLLRRFKRALTGELPPPNLVVVDGGKGQLSQAVQVLDDLGIEDVDVVALAKGRAVKGEASEGDEKTLERVFLPGRKNPVILRQNSAELFLLQRLRDEAHRVAITYHRKLRRKKTLTSRLDEIEGIGKKRRTALLKHFGSLEAIKAASVEELCEVQGISEGVARKIAGFFGGS